MLIRITRGVALAVALAVGARAAQAEPAPPAPPAPQAPKAAKKPEKRREIHITGRDLASLLWLPFAAFGGVGFRPSDVPPPKKKGAAKPKGGASAPKGTKMAKAEIKPAAKPAPAKADVVKAEPVKGEPAKVTPVTSSGTPAGE